MRCSVISVTHNRFGCVRVNMRSTRSVAVGVSWRGQAWYFNVKAHPAITVQDGDKVVELTAREVEGVEREQWWELAVAAYPPYAEYQTKTARLIPVFVLE